MAPYTFGGTTWQDTLATAQNQALITSGTARDLPVGTTQATPTHTHSTGAWIRIVVVVLADVPAIAEEALVVTPAIRATGLVGTSRRDALSV